MAETISPSPPGLPGRVKSGLIFALVGFVVGFGVGFLASICMVPLAALAGAAAGWLGAQWEHSPSRDRARRDGLMAGLLGGVGIGLGTLSGGILAALWSGPEVLEYMGRQMGTVFEPSLFWASAAVTICCVGILSLGAALAFGLLGGLAWYEWRGPGRAATVLNTKATAGSRGRELLLWAGGLLAFIICCVAGFLLLSWLTVSGAMGGTPGGPGL